MKVDVSEWHEFKFGKLIDYIGKAKALNKDDLNETKDLSKGIRYITRTSENNGCELLANRNDIDEKYIQKGNAITVGDTTATCFYQKEEFITGDHMVVIRAKWLNELTGLFIVSLLNREMYKYSYGRAFVMDKIKETILNLPVTKEGTPDWQFMEDYIKTLHYESITTKNKKSDLIKLETKEWKNICLSDYFDVKAGIYHYPDEYNDGLTPYLTASNENNGVGQYIDIKPEFKGNCIITGKIGCTAFYVYEDFCATSDVNIFIPKFNMTKYVGIFITTIINYNENYKWAYGRQCRVGNSKKLVVKLPVMPDGTPDWQFMEDYIKSLPYGDRI